MKYLLTSLLIMSVISCSTTAPNNSVTGMSGEIPESVIAECTTNEKIYFKTLIRSNESINKVAKRSAILKAIGVPEANANFAIKMFKGQWFYEFESDDAVYVGYKIRSHYLSVAVIYNEKGLISILCNSDNLQQKKKSIHDKASAWKGALDQMIRVELARISINENEDSEVQQ